MNARRILFGMLALVLVIALAAELGQAQEPAAGAESRLPGRAGAENTATGDVSVQQGAGGTIPYTGRLTGDTGQAVVEGAYGLSFALFAAETGGEPLWTEVQEGVLVDQDGFFSTSLGIVTSIPPGVLSGSALWLAVGVRGPGESDFASMAPRLRVGAASQAAPAAAAAGAACPHDHFGEVWTGSTSGDGLWINNDGTGDGLQVDSDGSNGVLVYHSGGVGMQVYQAANDGVYVGSAGDDGMYVNKAGNPSTTSPSTYKNGFEVAGAEGSGLWVGHADLDGVTVHSADWYGVYVEQSDSDGVRVQAAGGNGVAGISVNATYYGGLFRNEVAGGAGLYAAGGDNTAPDLELGVYGSGDDGRIYSYRAMTGSDILLFSNDETHIHLDEDNNSTSQFVIYNGANSAVWTVGESGAARFSAEAGEYGPRAVYAVQATGDWIEDFGSAQLVDGEATVTFEPVFAQMVNRVEYFVFLTPLGDCSLYVAGKTPDSFTVRAIGGQGCSIAFDYRLVAKRLGNEQARLEPAGAGPEEDD